MLPICSPKVLPLSRGRAFVYLTKRKGRESREIVITPDMLEAGVRALITAHENGEWWDDTVIAIYSSMARAGNGTEATVKVVYPDTKKPNISRCKETLRNV